LQALRDIEKEISEGEEKLKQAFNAGKKNTSDRAVKLQLQVCEHHTKLVLKENVSTIFSTV